VKVKPNQRFNTIERIGEEWIIRLKAPATDGLANKNLIEFLSEIFNIGKSKIQLKKGHTSRIKCLEIDADVTMILNKLQQELNEH